MGNARSLKELEIYDPNDPNVSLRELDERVAEKKNCFAENKLGTKKSKCIYNDSNQDWIKRHLTSNFLAFYRDRLLSLRDIKKAMLFWLSTDDIENWIKNQSDIPQQTKQKLKDNLEK